MGELRKSTVKPSRRTGVKRARASKKKQDAPFCVVAIGASAGGFEALVEFLRVMPANSGLAFIILQHLSPSPRSLSTELFARHTSMTVHTAEEGMLLERNVVYTTPADKDIGLKNGRIRLSSPMEHRGRRLPLDHLFRSLGEEQRERAIGIILSGTGADGALGLKTIVAGGGMVLTQTPESAQFDGMPRSAIETGLVAHVVPVAKMPQILLRYARHPYVRKRPSAPLLDETADPVTKILAVLEAGHGQRFAGYKPAMLMRRIERRIGLLNLDSLANYLKFLRSNPTEVAALRKDLLIGVTEFFRDRDAWESLDHQVLGPLIREVKPTEPIRAWVAGTGTGEEVYTLAILLLARLRRLRKRCALQIFATDANEDSLRFARAGRYPLGIRSQVPDRFIKRYFRESKDGRSYDIAPEVREIVTFGGHDLLADPPFSRLDLVSCRNFLIYIEPIVQERLLLAFHFALRPGGYLFLGSAETVGAHDELFRSVSRKARIFQRIGISPRHKTEVRAIPSDSLRRVAGSTNAVEPRRIAPLADLVRNTLHGRFAPAALLVNERLQVLYSRGPIELYLGRKNLPPGETQPRLPKIVRTKLLSAVRRARGANRPVRVNDLFGKSVGHSARQAELIPLHTQSEGKGALIYLLALGEAPDEDAAGRSGAVHSELQHALRTTQINLQNAVAQLKASNEDLRASHEETTSVNEELQSMNEELESSKEELQSVNEELNTVNTQLQQKVGELEIANADLRNLLASNEVASVCLDSTLRIKWFTPAAHRLFNFLANDLGRPIGDLSVTAVDSTLIGHAREVLKTEAIRSREVEHKGIHLRRIVPYRGDDSQIIGVVITFTDITEAKRAAQQELAARAATNAALEARVRERTEELAQLSRELALAEVRERQTIARDLHDGLGQELNAASIKLDALRAAHGNSAPLNVALNDIAKLLEGVVGEMRSLTAQLNPPVLDQLGLVSAIEWLGEQMRNTYHLTVILNDDGGPKPLDPVPASILFRSVRELLINVSRHAKVNSAEVTTRGMDSRLVLEVSDQGVGFSMKRFDAASGLGLATMRERINYIGGTFDIRSERNRGTVATIQVPLKRP